MSKFKLFFVLFISFTTFTVLNAQVKSEDKILGIYKTPNKKSKVEFIEKDGLYQGVLIWNVNPNIKDKFNQKEELKTLNLIGQTIFKNLKYNKYDRSWTGKFYDTESGYTYDCNLWFEYNKNNLMARGYIDNPIIGKTKILRRVVKE